MTTASNTRTLDLMKLLVAIVLLVVFIILLVAFPPAAPPSSAAPQEPPPPAEAPPKPAAEEPAPPEPPADAPEPPAVDKPDLPPFPKASFEWSFNEEDSALYSPDSDEPLYTFDAENKRWTPVVPADVTADLPDGAELAAGDGSWIIHDANGAPLYEWDPAAHSWTALDTGEPSAPPAVDKPDLPPFPEASFEWNYNPDNGAIYAPDSGEPLYTFDAKNNQWTPVISADAAADLPDGAELAAVDGSWFIQDTDGVQLYEWDPAAHSWKSLAAADTETATEPAAAAQDAACAALAARLEAGGNAKVLSTVNMRSEPGIGDNLVGANPPGAQLEVTGEPVCTPHGDGAYRWWPVSTADGAEGWTAEGTLNGGAYFLEPVE